MEGSIIIGGIEVVKLLIQAILRIQHVSGLSDEQIDAEWKAQKDWFEKHPPESLPDV